MTNNKNVIAKIQARIFLYVYVYFSFLFISSKTSSIKASSTKGLNTSHISSLQEKFKFPALFTTNNNIFKFHSIALLLIIISQFHSSLYFSINFSDQGGNLLLLKLFQFKMCLNLSINFS